MKKRIIKWGLFNIALCFVLSCSLELPREALVADSVVFTAKWAEDRETRTVLQADGVSIWWSPKEEISVFFRGYATTYIQTQFTSTNTSPAKIVNFQGSLPITIGSLEAQQEAPAYWAIYPYDATALCDGECVTMTVSGDQEGVENTFPEHTFPAIATSRDFTLAFYNVCGGIRFCVARTGITSVDFTSVGGEPLAGRVEVGFGSEGVPEIRRVLAGIDKVSVTAPAGGFVPGVYYFATLLPQRLSRGLSASFHRGTAVATVSIDKEIKVNRSRFGMLDNLDKDLVFIESLNPTSPIQFADPLILASCVAAGFDTDGDGMISFGEAAAVTSIEGVFTGKDYVSFNELRYFTGLTEIPQSCFSENRKLCVIALPEGVTRIGRRAFYKCSELTEISFPKTLISIGRQAFSDCNKLTRVNLGDFHSWLNLEFEEYTDDSIPGHYYHEGWPYSSYPFSGQHLGHLYLDGLEILNYPIPEGVTAIPDYRFSYLSSDFAQITLPKGFTTVGYQAFEGSRVRYVDIPSVADWLAIDFSTRNNVIFNTSGHLLVSGEAVTVVTIPEVERLSNYAFYRCTGIERFVMTSSVPPAIGGNSFGSEAPIYVPSASFEAYCEAWPNLANRIFPIDE